VGVQKGVQRVFRAANERLRERVDALALPGRRPVICECSDPDCMQILKVARREYEIIRADGHFVVVGGHEAAEIERVVARRDGYAVVDKD
jgi:hypothetical protein